MIEELYFVPSTSPAQIRIASSKSAQLRNDLISSGFDAIILEGEVGTGDPNNELEHQSLSTIGVQGIVDRIELQRFVRNWKPASRQ
jgi:hypothetical protein